MKKSIKSVSILLLAMMFLLVGCQNGKAKKEIFTGSAKEVYEEILKESGLEMGMTFDEAVTEETSASYIGLTAEEYKEYVDNAFASNAAITTVPHLAAVIKCKDFDSAVKVKELIAKGFDSGRWICVMPDESFVAESGSYVFLASTTVENVEPLKKGFTTAAKDTAGEFNVFYLGENNK